jgi:hypothetical protein
MIVHMRAGKHTACGIPLWGDEAQTDVAWVNDFSDADCPACVMSALPYTILPPVDGWKLE